MISKIVTCDLCGKTISDASSCFHGGFIQTTHQYLQEKYFDICSECLMRGLLAGEYGLMYSDTGEYTNIHREVVQQ